MNKLIVILISFSLLGCAPKVTTRLTQSYPSLGLDTEVLVVGITDETPEPAIEIGEVKVGDSGLSTNCGWDAVIEKAKVVARNAGGNVIKILEHTPPNLGSTCDAIKAKILKVDSPGELNRIRKNKTTEIDSSWDYAKIYVYRVGGVGALINYDLHLGDSVICRVKNNSKHELKITKAGKNSLWARTESKSEVPIDIEFGKVYYLRCSVIMGVAVGRPQIKLVDRMQGKSQYDSIKGK